MNGTIVGKGPSLLRLTPDDFTDGPVLTINHAILAVRALALPNPILTMQKDGCIQHDTTASVPLGCECPNPVRMVTPLESETVLLSAAESSRCFPDHPHRVVFDVEREFGLPWHTMSAVVAIRILHGMGCRSVRMLAMDSWTTGDMRRVDDGRTVIEGARGYRRAAERVAHFASGAGMRLEWA